jgi:hypothetical protein
MVCVARPEVEERVTEERVAEERVTEERVAEERVTEECSIEERVIEFVYAQVFSPGSKALIYFQYPRGSAVGIAGLRVHSRSP